MKTGTIFSALLVLSGALFTSCMSGMETIPTPNANTVGATPTANLNPVTAAPTTNLSTIQDTPAADHNSLQVTPTTNMDTATTRKTESGLYQVTIKTDPQPITINEIHTWTLHLQDAEGKPVEDAVITVGGGMPQHGHGLPTEPKVTAYLGSGDYRVEGVKFQMTGWWEIKFDITAQGKTDRVTFNLILS